MLHKLHNNLAGSFEVKKKTYNLKHTKLKKEVHEKNKYNNDVTKSFSSLFINSFFCKELDCIFIN